MGEIAEMMLDGTLCEACGEFMHEGKAGGIPRYCSVQCAASRGVVDQRQASRKPKRPASSVAVYATKTDRNRAKRWRQRERKRQAAAALAVLA